MTRYYEELQAAREMLDIVEQLDYNQLRANGARKKGSVADVESKRPIAGQHKSDLIKNKRQGGADDTADAFEGMTAE